MLLTKRTLLLLYRSLLYVYTISQLLQPSNHLDEQTLEALVDAIKRWKGTTIVVSHNRMFVESMRATHTVVIADGERNPYTSEVCLFDFLICLRPYG
jgi:ATP-binding cassette, subfamily F, member 3